ncbi:hypothetical protein [Xylella taiwanensis]|nr:hypothetical protein [Xylella taiwanensis]
MMRIAARAAGFTAVVVRIQGSAAIVLETRVKQTGQSEKRPLA